MATPAPNADQRRGRAGGGTGIVSPVSSGGRGWVGIDHASGWLAGSGVTRTASSAGGCTGSAARPSRSSSALGRAPGSLAMPARSRSSSGTGTPGRFGTGRSNSSISVMRLGSRSSSQRGGLPRRSA